MQFLLLITALLLMTPLQAAEPPSGREGAWQLTFPVYLSASAWYVDTRGSRSSFQTLSATAELVYSAEGRPWSVGLFADRLFSRNERYDGAVNAGGQFEYLTPDWDTSVYVFRHFAVDVPSVAAFASRVRYRFTRRQKIGLEVLGTFDEPEAPLLSVGYYGYASETLTFKLIVGANAKSGHDRVVRTELVWQVN